MNDGYVAVMTLVSLVILLGTGWHGPLLGGRPALPLFIVLGLSAALAPFTVKPGAVAIVCASVPPVLWAGWKLLRVRPTTQALWLQVAGLLLLSVWMWVSRHEAVSPGSTIVRESWDAPLLCGALSTVFARRLSQQAALLTVVSAAAGYVSAYGGSVGQTAALGWPWWDSLALALLSGRAAAAGLRICRAAAGRRRRPAEFGEGERGA